jgi:hypothetical protein
LGEKSQVVEGFERDPVVDADRRLAFLEAARGLGHLCVGFGELARNAIPSTRTAESDPP